MIKSGKGSSKVAIIGAGNVGATAAMMTAQNNLADVLLLDTAENIAQAKAFDMSHALAAMGLNTRVTAVNNFKEIAACRIVVVTAGFARKPGMSRENLLKINMDIIKDIAGEIKKNAPSAIVIMVTNPLDVMTYLAYKVTGFDSARVFGMAGILDSARFADFIADKLKVKRSDINAVVLGSHGDLMVPVFTQTKINGRALSEFLPEKDLEELSQLTKKAGARIVSLLGTGSAYYGPAASIVEMIKIILKDEKTICCVCAYLQGEYKLRDVCMGVPCVLGKKGIERIVELKLAPEELEALHRAAKSIKETSAECGI